MVKTCWWLYWILINSYGLVIMYCDKQRAKKHRYRLSEKHLWLTALLFGSFGTTAGMWLFSHKSTKPCFFIGFPLLCVLQIIIGCAIIYR